MKNNLSEKWIKASIIGTIWAASEIVLGSFLHNLKVPFSGNMLTAIGLIILISVSFTWNEKGLFWRAGLICAVMKTLSPSAVIFGPMIAIFMEAFLLELFVRLLGRTFAGYMIGAMFAMSWNLFHKIANYIIYYGSNIIEVYSNLLKFAQKQLNIQTDIVWLPVIVLLIIYALFGLLTAIIGIRVGRKILKHPASNLPDVKNIPVEKLNDNAGYTFNYSICWLIFDIILIISSFILLNNTAWFIWSLAITGIVVLWALRYKRALRQLMKPKFWVFFVLITLITAFAFTKAQPGGNLLKEGLLTGFQMNFRAAVIIVGFAVLGTELYNPRVRNFFRRTSIKNFPLALELSVKSLPLFIAYIPDFKSLIKNPVSIFYQVISLAERRLSEIRESDYTNNRVFIIAGTVGSGKTTYMKNLIDFFREKNQKVGGIIAERVLSGSQTTGYDLINIENGEKEVFLRQNEAPGYDTIGRFGIYPEGLALGKAVLNSLILKENTIIIIDEVGLLELDNKGWAESFSSLLARSENKILITVRDKYINDVKNKWNLSEATIFNITETDYLTAGKLVLK